MPRGRGRHRRRLVEVGGDAAEERFVLSYGDVVASSGDFFASHQGGAHGVAGTQAGPDGLTSDDLFQLAAIARNHGRGRFGGARRRGRQRQGVLEHLIELSSQLQARGVDLVVLDQGIDTSTAVGRMFFQILGSIAEFEHALMSELIYTQRRVVSDVGLRHAC